MVLDLFKKLVLKTPIKKSEPASFLNYEHFSYSMELKNEEFYKQTIERVIKEAVKNLPAVEKLEIQRCGDFWVFDMTMRYKNISYNAQGVNSHYSCINKFIDNYPRNTLYYAKRERNLEEAIKAMKKARNILTIDPRTMKNGACYIRKVKGQKFSICKEDEKIRVFPVLLLRKKKK